MSGGDFDSRMAELEQAVGRGVLRSEIVVDQVYARYQELGDTFQHPGGGQAHYTRDALYEQLGDIRDTWARQLLTANGSDIRKAGEEVAETMAQGVYERAPFEFGDLKASPHPTAADDGAVYYDRAPGVPRLTDDELRAKGDLRRLGFGNRGLEDADVRDALGLV